MKIERLNFNTLSRNKSKKERKNVRLHMEFMHFQMKFNLYFYVVCLLFFFFSSNISSYFGRRRILNCYSGFFFQMAKFKYNIKIIVEFYNNDELTSYLILWYNYIFENVKKFYSLIFIFIYILDCFILMS